jgi:hypothetical protein
LFVETWYAVPANAALRTLRAQLATALAQFLGDDFRWPVTVRVESRSGKLRLEFKPSDDGTAAGATGDTDGATTVPPERNRPLPGISEEISPDERAALEASVRNAPTVRQILDGADLEPRTSIEIAQRVEATCTPRWRHWVAVLVRLGYLERHPRTKKLRKLKDLDDD